jgi:hypothetical protein
MHQEQRWPVSCMQIAPVGAVDDRRTLLNAVDRSDLRDLQRAVSFCAHIYFPLTKSILLFFPGHVETPDDRHRS